jgi:hypothetical protein
VNQAELADLSMAEVGLEIDRLSVAGRLQVFLDKTAATVQSAVKLTESGDEEAERLCWKLHAPVDKVDRLLESEPDEADLDVARAQLDEAADAATDLAGYIQARHAELYPNEAAEADRLEADRIKRLTATAPAPVAALIRARQAKIAAARGRFQDWPRRDHDLVPVLLLRVRAAARTPRSRARAGRRPARPARDGPRRRNDDDSDGDDVDAAGAPVLEEDGA